MISVCILKKKNYFYICEIILRKWLVDCSSKYIQNILNKKKKKNIHFFHKYKVFIAM